MPAPRGTTGTPWALAQRNAVWTSAARPGADDGQRGPGAGLARPVVAVGRAGVRIGEDGVAERVDQDVQRVVMTPT